MRDAAEVATDPGEVIWEAFVERALVAIKCAAAFLNQPGVLSGLEGDDGWFGSPRTSGPFKGRAIPKENAITEALYERLRDWRSESILSDRAIPGLPDLVDLSFAIEQPPVRLPVGLRRTRSKRGSQAKRTDLMITVAMQVLDLRLEAKIVLTKSQIGTLYLGPAGAGRFSDPDHPYTLEKFGGMLAYVVDRTDREWHDDISAAVLAAYNGKASRFRVGAEEHVASVHDLPPGSRAWPSTKVVHVALQVETRPSSR